VFDALRFNRHLFSINYFSANKLYLLLFRTLGTNVITNIKAAMPKKYVRNACDTLYDNTHKLTKLAPCELLHHRVPKNSLTIMVHVLRSKIENAN
jgi:hypothetical protein